MKEILFNRFTLITILLIFTLVILIACQKTDTQKNSAEQSVPEHNESVETLVEFKITEPNDGGEVNRNVITVKGVGAQNSASIELEVFTNEWYPQNGNYEIRNDGSWTYSPCYLTGKGQYRYHHNIRAKLRGEFRDIASHTVYDVIAPEP